MTTEIIDETSFFDLIKDLIFFICCQHEFKFLIKLFVKKNSKNVKDYLEHACDMEKISIVKILMKKTTSNLDDAFNSAMFRRNVEISKLLLPRLADPEKALAISKNFNFKEIEILLDSILKNRIMDFRKINNLKEGF